MLAVISRFPGFEISDEEATKLGKATVAFLKEYNYKPAPKTMALLGLVTAFGLVDGPRLYQFTKHVKETKTKRAEKNEMQTPVYPFPGKPA